MDKMQQQQQPPEPSYMPEFRLLVVQDPWWCGEKVASQDGRQSREGGSEPVESTPFAGQRA